MNPYQFMKDSLRIQAVFFGILLQHSKLHAAFLDQLGKQKQVKPKSTNY